MINKPLDVVFVAPGNLHQVYQGDTGPAIEPPVLPLLVATYLVRKGWGVEMIDQVPLGLTNEQVAEQVSHLNPRLVVVAVYGQQPSASTQNMPAARAVCQTIRNLRPDLPILLTGTHPAALPERTLREEPVDFVCDGEGPVTIDQLLQALRDGGDRSKVGSLWYRGNGNGGSLFPQLGFPHTAPAPNVENLDEEIGMLEWDLLPPLKLYRAHEWQVNYDPNAARAPYVSLITTLGCPYHCTFCCIQAPFKSGEQAAGKSEEINSYRRRSPQVVAAEMEYLVEKHGVGVVKIHDEMFVLHQKHVSGMASEFRQRFGDSLNIWAYSRVDTTHERYLADLRSAGFRWLGIGVEAANSTVRDGAAKSFDDDAVRAVIRRVVDAGINPGLNYIFGLKSDTLESMQATLDLAMELNSPYANFYSAMAYPGSKLHQEAVVSGAALPETAGAGWIGYSQHAYETFPLGTETLSPADVLGFRDRAWLAYYTNPAYLDMMARHYSPASVAYIQAQTSKPPLRRRLIEQN